MEKKFSSIAKPLRSVFKKKFADPRDTRSDRFVWDYWHIEDQYSVLRTPARYFFPENLFRKLEKELVSYGQTHLGCNGISDPWISLYVDGSYQNLHSDSPHGPWAYVYSLTEWKGREFRGGETLVAKDELLNFWPNFSRDRRNQRGIELPDLIHQVAPEFNQLTLFDPRLPHGVKEVRGTRDPLKGRLVVHGWFVEPRPFIAGALSKTTKLAAATQKTINDLLKPLSKELSQFHELQGTVSVRVSVSPGGKPGKQELLTHTLLNSENPRDSDTPLEAIRLIAEGIARTHFPRAKGTSNITIPFLFRN